jgi:hypothetical protein
MRKYLVGTMIGACIATGTIAFADSNQITATTQLVNFVFHGNSQATEVINYQNKLYAPVRFVGENLGSTVTWNAGTSTVAFELGLTTPTDSTPVQVSPTPTKEISFPSVTNNHVTISITALSTKDNQTSFVVKLNNDSDSTIKFTGLNIERVEEGDKQNYSLSLDNNTQFVDPAFLNIIKPHLTLTGTVSVPMKMDALTDSFTLTITTNVGTFPLVIPIE